MAKKAFLVGINNYSVPKYQLSGCINDVESLRSLLVGSFAFPIESVTSIVDSVATKAGIIAGLTTLLTGAASGDTLVFGYSGHGCQRPSAQPGTQPNDMSDALVPYEATYSALLSDEELFTIIAPRIPTGVSFTALYDCCHSGTMIRDVGFDPETGALVPFVENRCIFLPELMDVPRRAVNIGPYNVFSACQDNETAADVRHVPIENRARGAFSYALHKMLRESPGITVNAVGTAITDLIKVVSPHPQNPEFYAVDPAKSIFGG